MKGLAVLKGAGGAILGVAVAIGAIGKIKPSLFMSIPNVGFVLWVLTGNTLPPYFSPAAWEESEMRTWIKDGDAVVACGAKSGTTWMLQCSHSIRTKGNSKDFPFTDASYSTPWPDFIQTPGESWATQKPLMDSTEVPQGADRPYTDLWNHPKYPFRVLKSHYTPKESGGHLPVKAFPKVKFLGMARNGLDVVASMVPFFDGHTEEFRETWGGFPPASNNNGKEGAVAADDKEFVDGILKDILPGGNLAGLYFDYVREWWPLRHEPNVLLLHYADAKKVSEV